MRILWSSNALWAGTGYGIQAKFLLPRFANLGHEIAQFAWYGLQGARLKLGDITIYPMGYDHWGNDIIGGHVEDFKADLVISLQDIWVLPEDYPERVGVPWACWFPIDQVPPPPKVLDMAKRSTYPIVYSKFGQEQMRAAGMDCLYIPHGVDCDQFKPRPRKECRERLTWPESPFVVSMVGTNKGYPPRKGFPEAFQAFKIFHEKYRDSILYIHALRSDTKGGINFDWLMDSIPGFPREAVRFVGQYDYILGLPSEYMIDMYNATDVLLQCSYGEGFGIPLIEAQACGTPVLATNWTSMPELVFGGKLIEWDHKLATPLGGWQVLPNVGSIVDGLEWAYEMLSAEQGKEWVKNQARFGAESYDWDRLVIEYWKPFLERVEQDIATAAPRALGECVGEGHDWAKVGIWDDDVISIPCRREGCLAELQVREDGSRTIQPQGFPMAIHGIPLKIKDHPIGTVAKIICREAEKQYALGSIPFEPGDVVLDIGAHVGIISIFLAKKYPFLKIYAFEPTPENREYFEENIKLNNIPPGTIQIFSDAISGDGRTLRLVGNLETNSGGISAVIVPRAGEQIWGTESITLEEIFETLGLDRVKLLKMDIEGAEYEVLQAKPEMLERVDYFVGEFHDSEMLTRAGYNVANLVAFCEQYISPERMHISRGRITR